MEAYYNFPSSYKLLVISHTSSLKSQVYTSALLYVCIIISLLMQLVCANFVNDNNDSNNEDNDKSKFPCR